MHIKADQRLRELLDQNPDLCEEYERTYKIKDDPRITKIGKILRKTSLDELPQFLNVIMGEMSVVGARPVLPPQFETHYNNIALTYCATRPGITGPWQIGARSDTNDYRERVELDRLYVLNCSFWLDIKIIFKTVWRILRPKGAY
jgi:lipopolysaccharide/colanic/teichoic acid biosynthesis glycosyltransferase